MNRPEHLAWCKQRALAYLETPGDDGEAIRNALTSMFSDLAKHPGTANHSGIVLVGMELFAGFITTRERARWQIEGFN